MKLKHFMLCLLGVTGLSIVYTWQQVEIVKLAYTGNKTHKVYKELLDRNHYLRYNLLNLKSSASLGKKLLDENTVFEIPTQSQVLSLVVPKGPARTLYVSAASSKRSKSASGNTFFLSALKLKNMWPVSFVESYLDNQAQAQDINHK